MTTTPTRSTAPSSTAPSSTVLSPTVLPPTLDVAAMLDVAVEQARTGAAEGGVPIGAALFDLDGTLLGAGRNRRVQHDDPSVHGETDAFRNAGRRPSYRDTVMVTTLSPCWYCSGLVRQFGIGHVVVGESTTFTGGHDWLAGLGVSVTLLDDERCRGLMAEFIDKRPDVWFEDIGLDVPGPDENRKDAP